MLAIDIHAIIGQLLSYNLKLLHAISHQFTNLVQNIFLRTGNVLAGDKRNGAICAAAVATLRNFDVSIVVRGGKMAALLPYPIP